MPFPLSFNMTCDIYRPTRSPPQTPDVAGARGHLQERSQNIKSQPKVYNYLLALPLTTDIRDAGSGDNVYVPDQNGTKFTVVWVERVPCGGSADYKIAYLVRSTTTFPTDQV
jgi:hypothetical protein